MGNKVNFFFEKGNLTYLNLICLESFYVLGYECVLWKYGEISNIPKYVTVKDANEIVSLNQKMEIRQFSDIFRYKLLYKYGGWWSDIDCICLKKLPTLEYLISGNNYIVNNHILRFPKNDIFLKEIIDSVQENINVNDGLYYNFSIIETILKKHKLGNIIVDENIFDPLKLSDIYSMGSGDIDINKYKDVYILHFYQSQLRTSLKENPKFIENLTTIKKYINNE